MHLIIKKWYLQHFSNPEAVVVTSILIIISCIFFFFGHILTPIFASLVIAYLLDAPIKTLDSYKIPHLVSVSIVFSLFCGLVIVALFVLLPLLWQQSVNFVLELPNIVNKGKELIEKLTYSYPNFISTDFLNTSTQTLQTHLNSLGQWVISTSIATIPSMFILVIYFVVVPLLVFFFLADKDKIIDWFKFFLPSQSHIITDMWKVINEQLGNYIRGKVIETLIVAVVTYICFLYLGLNYTLLLAVFVGLSVIIPFIGAVVVTIPVIIVALLQWGGSSEFMTLMIVYTIIMTLDANLLVPLLFSEAVKIHPAAIIIAIIFFGGIWGFWGIFFAIPLAVVLKTLMLLWPVEEVESDFV